MSTQVERLLASIDSHQAAQRGQGGSQILNGTGASATVPAGKYICAIDPVGATRKLGTVVGNCDGLSGFELPTKAIVYGVFTAVTVGPDPTDVFIVYFSV